MGKSFGEMTLVERAAWLAERLGPDLMPVEPMSDAAGTVAFAAFEPAILDEDGKRVPDGRTLVEVFVTEKQA